MGHRAVMNGAPVSRLMRFWLAPLAMAVVGVGCAGLGGELLLRCIPNQFASYHWRRILPRLRRQWLAQPQTNPLLPPFKLYANRSLDDPKRMQKILAHSWAASPGRWSAPDFLRSEEGTTSHRFTAAINSLGFRDPERSARRAPGVKRIVCLGAYQTFGHGVNDDEAYPRQLERLLNRQGGRERYEVWNAGRPAATAVVGLARLRGEILKLQPDLVILDYGFVDGAVLADDTLLSIVQLSQRFPAISGMVTDLRRAVAFAGGRSYLLNALIYMAVLVVRPGNVLRWEAAMTAIITELRTRGIPIIMLGDGEAALSPSAYRTIASRFPGVLFVDVREILVRHPVSESERAAFDRTENWTSELGTFRSQWPPYYPLLTDAWHPNGAGYRLIAEALAPLVARRLHLSRRGA